VELEATAAEVLARLPEPVDEEGAARTFPVRYEESMNTVVTQELRAFNGLLAGMRSSLRELRLALRGLVPLSPQLERLADELSQAKVPAHWAAAAYPSRKALGSWTTDLLRRLACMQHWAGTGRAPGCFWLPGLFFTHAFLTGTLQNHARRHSIPIDELELDQHVCDGGLDALRSRQVARGGGSELEPPATGAFVHGLFLEGARWPTERVLPASRALTEALPMQLHCELPVLWLRPDRRADIEQVRVRVCAWQRAFVCGISLCVRVCACSLHSRCVR
jgi:dynein heavy chain